MNFTSVSIKFFKVKRYFIMFRILMQFILIIVVVFSCSDRTTNPEDLTLIMVNSYVINVPQPSDLTFGKDYQTLWTVSDLPEGNVYEMDLQGNILRILDFKGDDLEGITYDHINNILWAVDEQRNEIIRLNPEQEGIERHSLPVFASDDHGLEGIAFENQDKIWLANEKLPKMIFLLDSNFNIQKEYEPELAEDYSGLCVNPDNCSLWIISDESQLLIKWSPCDNSVEKYTIPITKAEGIAINHQNGQIFIVSDAEQKLFELRIE
jgi:uncharacterized protein YjiK